MDNKIFTENIYNLPDLAKGYLFQVKFDFPYVDLNEDLKDQLTVRARKFEQFGDNIKITFDEFQDFYISKKFKYLKSFSEQFVVKVYYYDKELKESLYDEGWMVDPQKMIIIKELDATSDKKMQVTVEFLNAKQV